MPDSYVAAARDTDNVVMVYRSDTGSSSRWGTIRMDQLAWRNVAEVAPVQPAFVYGACTPPNINAPPYEPAAIFHMSMMKGTLEDDLRVAAARGGFSVLQGPTPRDVYLVRWNAGELTYAHVSVDPLIYDDWVGYVGKWASIPLVIVAIPVLIVAAIFYKAATGQ